MNGEVMSGGLWRWTARVTLRRVCLYAATAVFLCAQSGCGSAGDPVAARVGAHAITTGDVSHWRAIVSSGAVLAGYPALPWLSSRELALGYLLFADAVIGEARREGVAVPPGAVADRMREQQASAPEGKAMLEEVLKSTHRTNADYRREVELEMDLAALRGNIPAPQPSEKALLGYYRAHINQYHHPETRTIFIAELIPNLSQALQMKHRFEATLRAGRRLTNSNGKRWYAWYETLVGPHQFVGPEGKAAVVRSIFSSPVRVTQGPMILNRHYTIFVVLGVKRPWTTPFRTVRKAVAARVVSLERSRTRVQFAAEFERRWTAATACARAYVIQGCREYRGSHVKAASIYTAD